MTDEPNKRRQRKLKPSLVEIRLRAGARLLKTTTQDSDRGAYWTFADTGRAARGDVVERLIRSGRLKPEGDGLFPEDSQTWAYVEAA